MTRYVIIGAGFTGLSVAHDLALAGQDVTVLEADSHVGGLAGSFDADPEAGGEPLDRFYHHWFTSDEDVMRLVAELGLSDQVTFEPSLTGVWYNNRASRLSTPLDLLRFPALPFVDRVRLGWLALRARRVRDWRALESLTAAEWLRALGGENVWRVVWEPLLKGKFGRHADSISAVWMWNKLKLRGGSRGKDGAENLAYVRGSFARVAEAMAARIRDHGASIKTASPVHYLTPQDDGSWLIGGDWGDLRADVVIATPAPPLVAAMIADWASVDDLARLTRVSYLANLCLVLELDRALGSTYWLNVTDPAFPFVGVIEHTNFQDPARYGGRHIVYLSRYLPQNDALLQLSDAEVLDFALPHLQRMFPELHPAWILRHSVWRADWAQPLVERQYSAIIPPSRGPRPGLYLCSMAQIYPEDRGTNYAIREGRALAKTLLAKP